MIPTASSTTTNRSNKTAAFLIAHLVLGAIYHAHDDFDNDYLRPKDKQIRREEKG
jgi:hypothetical protein